jgi:hypothetical protein
MTTQADDGMDEPVAYAAPQDTGLPDAVERDPAALNSAEDLDEDRLRLDPLEAGMDPPERWSAADKYGTTPYEQANPRPLTERLAEEQPDVTAESDPPDDPDRVVDDDLAGPEPIPEPAADLDGEALAEAIGRGQAADEAGGSYASTERTPDQAP